LSVVDDEKLIRWALRKHMAGFGYEVLEAEDGQQALDVLDEEDVDLMLLDIRMPQKGGLEVLAHVTEHHSEIPVVLMTGFSSVEGAVDAMKRGAYDYLMKPFKSPRRFEHPRQGGDRLRQRRPLRGSRSARLPG
jgi:DNA-binding NtrC family response regulator